MSKEISNVNGLIKYLEYLIDYSDFIYSQNILTDDLYNDLKKEAKAFNDKVSNSGFIPPLLKNELLDTVVLEKYEKQSLIGLLFFLFKKLLNVRYESNYDDVRNERRENILEYRNRLDNIYKAILVKS